jgi:hypothetical protein
MHVSFTVATIPLLLLAALLWQRASGKLLPVAMFMSVFQAASVLNLSFGGLLIGVQPTYFVLLLALLRKFTQRRPKRNAHWMPALPTTLLLAGFVCYATATAFVSPFLFKGVLISNPKFGQDVPLVWELGHLNQLFYLLLSFALYLVAAYWTPPAELTKSINWFLAGVAFASLIGLYQFVALKTGLPFPREILHSNHTYSTFEGYEINGFPRMNSTFIEAAAAAFSMSVALSIALWRFLSRADSLRNIAAVLVIGMGLLLTISTTGYICLLLLLVVVSSRYFTPLKGGLDSRNTRVFLAVPILLFVFAALGVPAVRDSFLRLAHTVLLDKTSTLSYQERTRWNQNAFQSAADTYWLGAGWGVCRASSFIPTIFANVGIPGGLLFIAFCSQILRPIFGLRRLRVDMHGAVLIGLSSLLLNLFVSAPELTSPIIWLLFAMAAKFAQGAPAAAPARVIQPYPETRRFQIAAS